MSNHFRDFVEALGAIATALILVSIIFTSNLSETQKYFAVAMFVLLLYIVYNEMRYRKEEDDKKAVKGVKPKD